MRPVGSKPVAGTAWHEVQTDTGHTYWFNPTSQESCWEIPDDVRQAQQGQREQGVEGTRKEGGAGSRTEKTGGNQGGQKGARRKAPVVVDEKTMAAMRRAKANGAILAPEYEELLAKEMAEQLAKKEGKKKKREKREKREKKSGDSKGAKRKKKQGVVQAADEDIVGDYDVEFDEEDIMEKEEEGEGGGWSREKIEDGFRELLRQHGVHEFSRYQMVEKKIGGDPRFVAVADVRWREKLFEEFCAGLGIAGASSGGGGKQAVAQKRARPTGDAAFKALLQDKVKDHRARWGDVAHALEQDPRFVECPASLTEKQVLFDEHRRKLANAARQREVGDKLHARDLAAAEQRQAQHSQRDALMAFSALLGEVVRVPGAYEEVADILCADPQKRMLDDEVTAREMHGKHVTRLREVALDRLDKLYRARAWDNRLTFDEVRGCAEDDVEFLDFSVALQEEAWDAYRSVEMEKAVERP